MYLTFCPLVIKTLINGEIRNLIIFQTGNYYFLLRTCKGG